MQDQRWGNARLSTPRSSSGIGSLSERVGKAPTGAKARPAMRALRPRLEDAEHAGLGPRAIHRLAVVTTQLHEGLTGGPRVRVRRGQREACPGAVARREIERGLAREAERPPGS